MFAVACRLGAWCGGLRPDVQHAAAEFGTAFGVEYQLVDDLLDVAASPDRLGKPVGVDSRTGVYTVPVLLALEATGGKRLAVLLQRRQPDDAAEALKIVRASPAMRASLGELRAWVDRAESATTEFGVSATAKGLRQLPRAYAAAALRATTLDEASGEQPDPLAPRRRSRPLHVEREPEPPT